MTEPRWVPATAIFAMQAALIEEHGGLHGVRDEGLLDSALARPANQLACGKPDLVELAAAYGFGLCRNHPFLDGNKRISLAVADVFLQLNGRELTASEEEAVVTFRDLAEGNLAEDALAEWIRTHSTELTE